MKSAFLADKNREYNSVTSKHIIWIKGEMNMNLKESYRYANFLESLLISATNYLCRDDFVTTTKEDHLRSKANKDA